MRALYKLSFTEMKLFFREPAAAFFTLAFPLMMLFLFGSIYGNKPSPFFGGYGSVDISVPAYTAMIIATSGLIGLTIILSTYREKGILRRLKATPLTPWTILTSQVLVIFLMTTLGMVLLVVAAKLVYNLKFDGSLINVLLAFILSSMSFFALGFILAGLTPTARTAQVVSMVLFYPMIFLSGATIPREVLPETIRSYSPFVVLTTHFMEEAERLCDRVAIVDRGQIVALDTPEKLIESLGAEKRVVFTTNGDFDSDHVSRLQKVSRVDQIGERCVVYGESDTLVVDIVNALASNGIDFRDLRTEQPSLEDVFLALTGKETRN